MKTKNKMLPRIVATCAFLLSLTLPCAASDIQNPSPATAATTPGGVANSIQFNNGGAFGGFGSWNGTTFTVPGAANSLNLAGSSTGNPVTISATGSDAEIDIAILAKGLDGQVTIGPRDGLADLVDFDGHFNLLVQSDEYGQIGFRGVASADTGPHVQVFSARGTLAIPTATQADDSLLVLDAYGRGATGWGNSGQIEFTAAENWTDTAQGTLLRFRGIKTGTTTQIVALEFNGLKTLIGGTEPTAIPALTSNGFVKTSGGDGTLSVQTGGVTASGATCTITAITGGIITAGSCL